jgi:hypothetical protein
MIAATKPLETPMVMCLDAKWWYLGARVGANMPAGAAAAGSLLVVLLLPRMLLDCCAHWCSWRQAPPL